MCVRTARLVLAALLVACAPEEREFPESIRAIKTYTVRRVASGRVRHYSGIVEAADYTALSFEVPGNVQTVDVGLGDRVIEDQVLATLDKEPYELDVQAARADLSKAHATLAERKANYERYKSILHTGAVSRADYERALASYEASESSVSFASSRLNLARRDLTKTVLRAPYDGAIGWKQVEPHMDVTAGQKLFQINAEGGIEVRLAVPETTINQVAPGMEATATFPTLQGVEVAGEVSEVGSVATTANAYPVKIALLDPPDSVRTGMTAELSLLLAGASEEGSVLVPISALAPAPEPGAGHVFVFDEETSTVRKVFVRGGEGVDNFMAIHEGVQSGDVVAVAGVNFLVDGQKVKLLQP